MLAMPKLLVVLVVCLSGCSLAFQRHLADGSIGPTADASGCSASRRLPWADVAVIGAEVTVALAGEAMHDGIGFSRREDTGTVITGVALFAALLQTASAGNGFSRADACKRAKGVTAALAAQ